MLVTNISYKIIIMIDWLIDWLIEVLEWLNTDVQYMAQSMNNFKGT